MNTRELFIETMNFNKNIRSLKWEYAYWGSTIKNWYKQGLPEKNYPKIPIYISSITSSLYTRAWTNKIYGLKGIKEGADRKNIELPDGIAVWGNVYRPTQGFPIDIDVGDYFNFDKSVILVDVEQMFYPRFEIKTLEEDDSKLTYIDLDGVKRVFLKKEATIPTAIDWPIKDWESWNKIKEERLRLDNVRGRFPDKWDDLVGEYKNRDYPLSLGGYPLGIFGTLAHLIGYEKLFIYYYDKPDLLKDILNTFTDVWIAVWEEVISRVDIDCVHIWEDVSTGTASMVSPAIFKEFMTPYYKRLTSFLKGKGVNIILLDTDGDCNELIPLFLEAGITGLWPMEVSAGMNVLAARKKYPELQIMGGIPKLDIAFGKKRIDEFLEPVGWLLKQGGYIPFGDHSIPPRVSWKDFKYYRGKLNKMIDKMGSI